jgi:hypothetical protein
VGLGGGRVKRGEGGRGEGQTGCCLSPEGEIVEAVPSNFQPADL